MEQKKSRMLRLTLMGGQARVFYCDTTELAQQARDIHNASNTCSAAMGRMLAATAIMVQTSRARATGLRRRSTAAVLPVRSARLQGRTAR